MIDEPQVLETEERDTAVIRMTVPRAEIEPAMDAAIAEVFSAVGGQGVPPAGPVFTYHFAIDPETFDFEVGVPVARPVSEQGRVRPGRLPAATVARTVYHGGYDGLGAAWGELKAWVAAAGHQAADHLWECYTVGPESGPDPSTWRTELNQPLRGTSGANPDEV